MALLYSWATKEYLLWEMSLGQIILYNNLGIEIKYPVPTTRNGHKRLVDRNYSELKAIQDDMIKNGLIDAKDEWREKYGEV